MLAEGENPETPINVQNLKARFEKSKHLLSQSESELMKDVISNLEFGVTTPFKHLPEPLWAQNSDSLLHPDVGAAFTDNVCTWLKSGYLCGPFTEPPLPNLRINQVFAVEQPDKFRNIVNMSFSQKKVPQ